MEGELNDATTRLYAGALLGKSLAKELGQEGAEGTQATAAARRATLVAGIASGKIKGSQLSRGDAGLVGAALSGNLSKENIKGGPLGILGDVAQFGKNFVQGAGEFGASLGHIPQGLYRTGKAFEEEAGKTFLGDKGNNKAPFMEELGAIGKSVAHDFSSPRQIYEHPFNPVLDLASVFSGGASAAIKGAGAISRTAEEGSALATTAKRVAEFGSHERTPLSASPGFTAKNFPKLAEQGIYPNEIPRSYSPFPTVKYGIQKPLDVLFNRFGERKLHGSEETLNDWRGNRALRREVNKNQAAGSSGVREAFSRSPAHDIIETQGKIRAKGQGQAVYQEDASYFRLAGIKTEEKLNEYAERLRNDEDFDGKPSMDESHQVRAEDMIRKIEDPTFRDLVLHPTDLMRELEHHYRRLNVYNAYHLNVDPRTSEDAAFARIKELTGKTNDGVKAEMPAWDNQFAKGLQEMTEEIVGPQGEYIAGAAPPVAELARHVPGVDPSVVEQILVKARDSLKADAQGERSVYELRHDPNYLIGDNLYDKVAIALADRKLLHPEQAQAIARGINFGEDTPTYMPSTSIEGMHYGVRGDPLKQRVGRVLGVSRFRPIVEDIPRQPEPFQFKRPFVPSKVTQEVIGLGAKRDYLKQADYESFLKGVQQTSPEMVVRNAYKIQEELVGSKLEPRLLEKISLKDAEGKPVWVRGPQEMIDKLGEQISQHYTFLPVQTWRDYVSSKAILEKNFADYIEANGVDETTLEDAINNLADESAAELLDKSTSAASMGNHLGLVVPKTYVDQFIKHVRVAETTGSKWGQVYQNLIGRWKSAVLSWMPKWLLNTTIGHGLVAIVHGALPLHPSAFKAIRYVDSIADRPLGKLPADIEAGKEFGDTQIFKAQPERLPFGINQGAPVEELADLGQSERVGNLTAIPRTISGGVHTATNWQRRAIFLHELNKAAKQRLAELGKDFEHPGGFWDIKNIDAVLDPQWREAVLKDPDLIDRVMDQLHQVSYTFGYMNPWERRLTKLVIPFYGWYKFISTFIWSMPVRYPGRAAAFAALGKLGAEETDKMGVIPDYLESALWFNHNDLSHARYMPIYGLNPFENFANPLGPKGLGEGLISAGQMSPLLQAIITAKGIDPMTGEPVGVDPFSGIEQGKYGEWINTKTGREYGNAGEFNALPRFIGTFLRSFPEIRTGELLATGGNPVYPESIPFIDEHLKGVKPQTRRSGTIGAALLQELGLQPRTYDILSNTVNHAKALEEAKKKNEKAQQRTLQRLSE